MKKAINLWAFSANQPFEQMLERAKDAGFDGVELNIDQQGYFTMASTQRDAERLRSVADKLGVELTSLCTDLFWRYSLTSDREDERIEASAVLRTMIDSASWLGTRKILIVPGAVENIFSTPLPSPIAYDVVYERARTALREVVAYAQHKDVEIGVENVWNKFLMSPLEFRDFIDGIGSPHVGAYFDVGNILALGYPEHWIKILGKRIKQVHVKDFKKTAAHAGVAVGLLEGDVNWKEVMAALRSVGYEGYLVAELWPVKSSAEWRIYETARALEAIVGL